MDIMIKLSLILSNFKGTSNTLVSFFMETFPNHTYTKRNNKRNKTISFQSIESGYKKCYILVVN